MLFLFSLREDLLQVIERQNREMTVMKKDLDDIKRLLTQTLIQGQFQTSTPITQPTAGTQARDSAKTEPSAVAKTRKHHIRPSRTVTQGTSHPQSNDTLRGEHDSGRSTSLPVLGVRHGSSSLPGIDIRRQQPQRDVALVAPRQDLGSNGSKC